MSGVDALLNPRNVAVVGASSRARSMGMSVLEALRFGTFPGNVYPVNARYAEIAGLPCYPSLSALPETPDHVVVVVPAPSVNGVVAEAIAAGARSATIMSSGFEGDDPATGERRDALRALIGNGRIAVSGPNCMGNFNAAARFFTIDERRVPIVAAGSVAIAGQSGGVVLAIYRSLWDRGVGASRVVTTGDELGLAAADYIRYFTACDDVRVIVYYIEGLRDAASFASACRAATSAGKRVITLKIGASATGRAAAAAHTGSVLGALPAFDALLESTGAVRAATLDEAVEGAVFLAHADAPRNDRVGVVVYSGGLKSLVSDAAGPANVRLAELAPATMDRLRGAVAAGGSLGNPLDFGPPIGGTFDTYLDCVRALRGDPNVDVVLLQDELLRAPGGSEKEAAFRRLNELVSSEAGHPVAVFAMLSHSVTDQGRTTSASLPRLPFVQEPAKVLSILGKLGRASAAYRAEEPRASGSPAEPHDADAASVLAASGVRVVRAAERLPAGIELVLAVKRDPEVGASIVLRFGGAYAELFDDTATAVPPIDTDAAAALVGRLRGARLLAGFAGKKRADLPALYEALVALGELALARPDLGDVEVNPLVVLEEGSGAFALDPGSSPTSSPSLARGDGCR